MRQSGNSVCPRRLALDGALGISMGALAVVLILTVDLFGFGTMVQQTDHKALFLSMMLFKPTMLAGALALGWSVWRQVGAATARIESSSTFPTWIGRWTPAVSAKW